MSDGAEGSGGLVAPFRIPSFRALWAGAFLSSVGTWTQDVALAWLIHTQLAQPYWLGLRSFAAEAPLLAFMLVGGVFADRVDRRRILLTSQFLQMTFAAALAVLYAIDRLGIAAILVAAFLTGLAQSQSAPTYQATITTLVPPKQIPNAVALNSLQFNLSRVIGPAIAGLLLARVGVGACLAVNAFSFVGVIVALWTIAFPPARPRTDERLRDTLRAGLAHVWHTPAIRLYMALALGASILAYPITVYMPVIADEVLHSGAEGFSMLMSSFGVGAIGGAILTAQRGHVPGRGRILLLSFAAFAASTIGAVLVGRQYAAMALLAVSGWMLVTAFSTLNSLVQETVTDEFRGRVLSIYSLAFRGGMPLGSLLVGALAEVWSVPTVLAAGCALLGAAALLLQARGTLRAV